MATEFQNHPKYDPARIVEVFEERNMGWQSRLIDPEEADLVEVDEGAALECVDGRFANRPNRKRNAPKIPGGINAIALLKTGGDPIGINVAAREVGRLGVKPGTHRDCGLYGLWKSDALKSARHGLVLPRASLEKLGDRWIKLKMKHLGGKHFYIAGPHGEKKLRISGILGMTLQSHYDQFSYDHGFMLEMGINIDEALGLVAETVEQLSLDCRSVEIVTA